MLLAQKRARREIQGLSGEDPSSAKTPHSKAPKLTSVDESLKAESTRKKEQSIFDIIFNNANEIDRPVK